MRYRLHGHAMAVFVGLLLVSQWPLTAQTPSSSSKRPLMYDAVDYWRSIQGTRLSNDGQWLAYALTAQGDDGELVVRNTRTGQEFRHPRGTAPSFTSDGTFVVFTIAQSKADEEKERLANRRRGEPRARCPRAPSRSAGSPRRGL